MNKYVMKSEIEKLANILNKICRDPLTSWSGVDDIDFLDPIKQVSKRFNFKTDCIPNSLVNPKRDIIPFYSYENDVFSDLGDNYKLFSDCIDGDDLEDLDDSLDYSVKDILPKYVGNYPIINPVKKRDIKIDKPKWR